MNKHLVIMDFDGTIADTMRPSPRGMDVLTACKFAITDLFGKEGYIYFTEKLGGLRNREPGELIKEMLNGLGMSQYPHDEITEEFVDRKLDYLVSEINTDWPKLYPGARDFFNQVYSGEIPVDVGIVSSGHDSFIKKVFEVNQINPPEILVTSDILRQRKMPTRERYKPNPYLLAVAHRLWQVSKGDIQDKKSEKDRMLYIGDDPVKDGGLAIRSRIPFVYTPFTKDGYVPLQELGQTQVLSFHELSGILLANASRLREGTGMSEILFGKSYGEVFSPFPEGQRLYDRMIVSGRGVERT